VFGFGFFLFVVFFVTDSMALYWQIFSNASCCKNSISADTRCKPAMVHRMTIQTSAHNHMIILVWMPSQAELGPLSATHVTVVPTSG